MKRLFLLFFSAMLCTAVSAHNFEVDGIYYNITLSSDLTVSVTYQGSSYNEYSDEYSGSVVIPEKVTYNSKEYSVTSIGQSAFRDCSGLTSVTIPNSVTSIGYSAFLGCDGLTAVYISDLSAWCKIKFGDNPTSYAHHLYLNGEEITNLVIPDDITSIGGEAFYGCSGLTSVTIPNSVTSIEWYAFYGCSGLTSVSIPNSVTSIGGFAFYGCSGLTSVTIPNPVTSIGENAFRGCSGLTSVTIPNSVTSIENETFYGCSGLTSVTIPNSVTSIGYDAFYGCSGLTAVHISDLSAWCKIKFGDNPTSYAHHLYLNGEEITNLVIPDDITSIEKYAFEGCKGLISVTIPNSVTSIGKAAFSGCSGLTSVDIPNSVTSIGNSVFSDCFGLTSVTIPNSVTSIESSAFQGCSGLTAVHITDLSAWCKIKFGDNPTFYAHHLYLNGEEIKNLIIPDDVTSIGYNAFLGCSGLTSVTIPNSVTSIGYNAFRECSGLTSVTIPNFVTSIGEYAFEYCSGLTSVTIPNSVTSIGEYTFSNCFGLTSIYIPESVTRISQEAFYGCSRITRIDCMAATPPLVYNKTFSSEIYTKATLNVPEGCAEAYQKADYWKEFIKITAGNQEQCAAPVITYADGKLQFACETAGAECKYTLTAKDIQTAFITASNNSVDLTACYDITVYAVAEGYTNSEQVTATLYWINGSDVSTNINQTEMRGVMATCSGGIITVSGLSDGETVMFYDANGALLYTGTAQNGIISYAPSASAVIIVKIGKTSIKVVK